MACGGFIQMLRRNNIISLSSRIDNPNECSPKIK